MPTGTTAESTDQSWIGLFEPGMIVEFPSNNGPGCFQVGRIRNVCEEGYEIVAQWQYKDAFTRHKNARLYRPSWDHSPMPTRKFIPVGSRAEYVDNGRWKPCVVTAQFAYANVTGDPGYTVSVSTEIVTDSVHVFTYRKHLPENCVRPEIV